MEDPIQDNSTSENGTAETNAAGNTLENIMGNMTASNAPEAKPVEGNKAEGKENGSEKAQSPAWTSQLPEEIRSNAELMKQLDKFAKLET